MSWASSRRSSSWLLGLLFTAALHQSQCFMVQHSRVGYAASIVSFSSALRATSNEDEDSEMFVEEVEDQDRRNLMINAAAVGLLGCSAVASAQLFLTQAYTPGGFKRLASIQFIAALGDPNSSQGQNAQDWGLWRLDPGPRGVFLRDYQKELGESGAKAPSGWTFDASDWWLEEHGIIMEAPTFPLQPGRYLVTGGRMVTTGLTVSANGDWKLDEGKLYDVTHLPCRSARYHPNSESGGPLTARLRDFPVTPGAEMPKVPGCDKQDYVVLFLVGKAA